MEIKDNLVINILGFFGLCFLIAGIFGITLIDNFKGLLIDILYNFFGISLILIWIILKRQQQKESKR